MRPRALLVSTANPYPVVRDGCQRLVHDYVHAMFPGHDMLFLHAAAGDWSPLALYRDGQPVSDAVTLDHLLAHDLEFVVFIGFKATELTTSIAASTPTFCYTDTFPHPDVPAGVFRGILSHRCSASDDDDEDMLLIGGHFDDEVFYPQRGDDEFVLCVGRIHPDKAQLELVTRYREAIFARYGLPLVLVGGASDPDYFRAVEPFIDGVAVVSTIADPTRPDADDHWRSAGELAQLCNRARLFVSASPQESFSMSMVEAIACGTTCVVNGDYWGFSESDLRPNVHGNITGAQGSVLDLAADALSRDVRIDGSQWARKYSLHTMRETVSRFVDARL